MSQSQEKPGVNLTTRRAHRREKRNQIYGLFILVGVLPLALILAVLLVAFGDARLERLSIVADSLFVCMTVLPCIAGVLIIFAANTGLVVGMGYVNRGLPPLFKKLQDGVGRLGARTTDLMAKASSLLIAFVARLESLARTDTAALEADHVPDAQQKRSKKQG